MNFHRKATRQIVDTWLVSHTTLPSGIGEPGTPPYLQQQNSNSRTSSGATTPVRKISAHEFEKGGLLKPMVSTIDGTPTFLSVSPTNETHGPGVSQPNTIGPRHHRRSRHELRHMDEKELIFELVSKSFFLF